MSEPVRVIIDELADGRYVCWIEERSRYEAGQVGVETLVAPHEDVRNTNRVMLLIGQYAADIGFERDLLITRKRQVQR